MSVEMHVGSKHLVADVAVALDAMGHEHLVVVAKGTWSIPVQGQRPRPLPPEPLVVSDQYYGEPGESALRCGSDFARFKALCDVIFDASAHAPEGKPTKEMDVRVQVGAMKKHLRVFGPRYWQRTLGLTQLSGAELFTKLPLNYGQAFGGTRSYEKGKEHLCEALLSNPSGIGYAGPKTLAQIQGARAPSLEDPRRPVKSPTGKTEPHALSAIARHWSPRRELAGTYDDKWREEVFPLLPADFDEAFHQVAPVDQRIAHPQGGESVRLEGVFADRATVSFSLPSLSLFAHAAGADDRLNTYPMRVDTLFFEPDATRFSAIWRTPIALRRRMQEIASIAINSFESDQWFVRQQRGLCAGCGSVTPRWAEEPT